MGVYDYSTNPDNNGVINGVPYFPENQLADSLNNSNRQVLADIAAFLAGIIKLVTGSTVKDATGTERLIGYRGIPQNPKTAAYTLALTDIGTDIPITTGGITIPLQATVTFPSDYVVGIYNDSASAQSITGASGVTLRLAGVATTGTRTIAQRGYATLRRIRDNEWIVLGAGVT